MGELRGAPRGGRTEPHHLRMAGIVARPIICPQPKGMPSETSRARLLRMAPMLKPIFAVGLHKGEEGWNGGFNENRVDVQGLGCCASLYLDP